MCSQHVPRATDDLRDRSVLARLDALLKTEVPAELLLTGGEPTLHPRLATIVRKARENGVERVVLATNGFALGDPRRVARLVQAGVTRVRIALFGVGEDAAALSRHPRAWELATAGIEQCVRAGVEIELGLLICASTVAGLPALAELAAERWPAIRDVLLMPYRSDDRGAPAEEHVLPRDVERTLRAAMKTWAAADVRVRPEPGYGYHLCAFDRPRGLGGLIRHGAPSGSDDHVHPAACDACVLKARCTGVERSLHAFAGDDVVVPWTNQRRAQWLPLFERTEASDRTDRIALRERSGERVGVREQVIRILHACNQRCAFCWVDFDAPAMSEGEVLVAIAENLAAVPDPGEATITFTGGEPTMHPDILALIRGARALGAGRVHMQTNAVRCADPKLASELAAAGLTEALVSLHADEAGRSDALTAAPGTFERTLRGIGNLCDAGVDVVINHVLTREQAPRFPAFVTLVADRLQHERLLLTVAVAGRIDRGPLDERVLPTMAELAPHVRAGLLAAQELGLRVRDVAHPCGVPPCIAGADLAVFDRATMRRIAADADDGCVKPPSCAACAYDAYCHGVRREYADDHGTAELVPIPIEAVDA